MTTRARIVRTALLGALALATLAIQGCYYHGPGLHFGYHGHHGHHGGGHRGGHCR